MKQKIRIAFLFELWNPEIELLDLGRERLVLERELESVRCKVY